MRRCNDYVDWVGVVVGLRAEVDCNRVADVPDGDRLRPQECQVEVVGGTMPSSSSSPRPNGAATSGRPQRGASRSLGRRRKWGSRQETKYFLSIIVAKPLTSVA